MIGKILFFNTGLKALESGTPGMTRPTLFANPERLIVRLQLTEKTSISLLIFLFVNIGWNPHF
jgi:hypothetical protein